MARSGASSRNSRALATIVSFALIACGGDSTSNLGTTNGQTPRSIRLEPSAIVLDAIGATEHIVASVRDTNGGAIEGAGVEWTTASSAVTLALPTVITDARVAAAVTALAGPEIIVVAASSGVARVTATSGNALRCAPAGIGACVDCSTTDGFTQIRRPG